MRLAFHERVAEKHAGRKVGIKIPTKVGTGRDATPPQSVKTSIAKKPEFRRRTTSAANGSAMIRKLLFSLFTVSGCLLPVSYYFGSLALTDSATGFTALRGTMTEVDTFMFQSSFQLIVVIIYLFVIPGWKELPSSYNDDIEDVPPQDPPKPDDQPKREDDDGLYKFPHAKVQKIAVQPVRVEVPLSETTKKKVQANTAA